MQKADHVWTLVSLDVQIIILRSDDIEYKLCAGCYNDMYCDSACQRDDWKSHRTVCKAWQKSLRDGSQVPISQHDRNFLHFVAAIHFCNNIRAIKADIAKRFASTAVSSLNVELAYIGTPSIVVYPVDRFPWGDEDEKSELETLLHRVRTASGNQMLVQVHVRTGYSPNHGVILRKFPLLITLPPNWFQD